MEEEPAYDPFYHVRKGGPKEKRLRRVELMGEHSPKPIYYIKVTQSLDDEYLSDDVLYEHFSNRIGQVVSVYRPVDLAMVRKDFALVGFLQLSHVHKAIELLKRDNYIDGISVVGDEAKPWLIDLYPMNN